MIQKSTLYVISACKICNSAMCFFDSILLSSCPKLVRGDRGEALLPQQDEPELRRRPGRLRQGRGQPGRVQDQGRVGRRPLLPGEGQQVLRRDQARQASV